MIKASLAGAMLSISAEKFGGRTTVYQLPTTAL